MDGERLAPVLRVREQRMFSRLWEGSLFQQSLRFGDFCQSGQHNLKVILDRGKGDNTIGSFWVEEACTERSLDSWAVWQRDYEGSASLPMRTRWTSWTCLVCGATIVDFNGGRRGRTTCKQAGPCPLYRNEAVQSWLQHIWPAPSPCQDAWHLQTARTWLAHASFDLNLCNMHRLPRITGFTCLTRYCSEPTHASRFCLILIPLGASVTFGVK